MLFFLHLLDCFHICLFFSKRDNKAIYVDEICKKKLEQDVKLGNVIQPVVVRGEYIYIQPFYYGNLVVEIH